MTQSFYSESSSEEGILRKNSSDSSDNLSSFDMEFVRLVKTNMHTSGQKGKKLGCDRISELMETDWVADDGEDADEPDGLQSTLL